MGIVITMPKYLEPCRRLTGTPNYRTGLHQVTARTATENNYLLLRDDRATDFGVDASLEVVLDVMRRISAHRYSWKACIRLPNQRRFVLTFIEVTNVN